MSQKQSAYVPPPTDYAPKPRPHNASKHRDKTGRDHGRRDNRHGHQPVTFHRDQQRQSGDVEKAPKNQPRDKSYRDDDDDYFARVQDEEDASLRESSQQTTPGDNQEDDDDDDDDPLDAYMKSLEADAPAKESKSESPEQNVATIDQKTANLESDRTRSVRLDIDETDDVELSYYKYVEERKNQSDNQEEDERQDLVEYDTEGNIISVRAVKRDVEPLSRCDHSTIDYRSFVRNLYQEHSEIATLTTEQSDELRKKLEIKVCGDLAPKPVCSFAHFRFDEKLMKVIRRSEYYVPTPIQAQAIPAALSGRNVIGVAVTGSGKTAAYLWPMIVHIMKQPNLRPGDGPIGLVLVPTRELAQQVYGEAKKFSHSYRLNVVCAYGGGSRYEQARDLESGAEIVVATPGRLIDLIKSDATNLRRVTYLVLDEADTFFKMGFEVQVRSICDNVRPDRQTLLFSATFEKRVEQLARSITEDPVKIIQKTIGEANEDVTQHIVVLPKFSKKWDWLNDHLDKFKLSGSVLIFVTRIVNSSELHENLKTLGKDTLLLHGDMEQAERNRVITAFKRKVGDIMIATDVAARGLDISHIRTVINYDVARDIDTHIHRIGRTGRAGLKGDAYTLLTCDRDKEFAGHLVKRLKASQQEIGEDLMSLAMQSHNFRKSLDPKRHKYRDKHRSSSSSTPGQNSGPHHESEHVRSDVKRDNRNHSSNPTHRTQQHRSSSHRDSSSRHSSSFQNSRSTSDVYHQGESRTSDRHTSYEQDYKRSKWH